MTSSDCLAGLLLALGLWHIRLVRELARHVASRWRILSMACTLCGVPMFAGLSILFLSRVESLGLGFGVLTFVCSLVGVAHFLMSVARWLIPRRRPGA